MASGPLSSAQIAEFVESGYLVASGLVSEEVVEEWASWAHERIDDTVAADPAQSARVSFKLPGLFVVDGRTIAPRAWEAACQLLGGEERVERPWSWTDYFQVHRPAPTNGPWQPPPPLSNEWHIDGDWFRHFLDAPEWALVCLVCWTDAPPHGAATVVAERSVRSVARHLLQHPEGLDRAPLGPLVTEDVERREVCAEAGDVLFMHRLLLHASSPNQRADVRILSGHPVSLLRPLCYSRDDGAYSPVEQAVLQALGVTEIAFERARETARFLPPRLARQEEQRRAELTRMRRSMP